MPDRLDPSSVLVRALSVCAALLMAIQVASLPAIAAPAHDDELIVTEPVGADEAAVESVDEAAVVSDGEADETVAEPAQDEAEPGADAVAELADEQAEADAESIPVEEEAAPSVAEAIDEVVAAPMVAAPFDADDEVDDAFLRRLLDAINERRQRNGTQRLSFVPARANAALNGFLAEKVGACDHQPVHGYFSWDIVLAAGFGGDPRGEVIACAGPEPYWTPDRTAERWWDSPIHHDILYGDGDSNSIACSAYGVQGGSNEGGKKQRRSSGSSEAASAVLCVTFRG